MEERTFEEIREAFVSMLKGEIVSRQQDIADIEEFAKEASEAINEDELKEVAARHLTRSLSKAMGEMATEITHETVEKTVTEYLDNV